MGTRIARLPSIEVASPCTVSWDGMRGDDTVRFCGKCRLNVYNLSAMTQAEAAAHIAAREGRMCVRFYRRPDGTVMTRDCGSVARKVARGAFTIICTFVALVLTGSAIGLDTWMTSVRWPAFLGGAGARRGTATMGAPVPPKGWLPRPPSPRAIMGEPIGFPTRNAIMGALVLPKRTAKKAHRGTR